MKYKRLVVLLISLALAAARLAQATRYYAPGVAYRPFWI
jgi:hypothetical protein